MHRQGLGICINIDAYLVFIMISLQNFHFICLSKMSYTNMQDLDPVICLIHCKVKGQEEMAQSCTKGCLVRISGKNIRWRSGQALE